MASERLTVLHVSPHPDDEALGAPMTLLGLRAAGHRVVVLCCSLGRPGQRERRRGELEEACRRGGWELALPPAPIALSRTDDLAASRREIAGLVAGLVEDLGAGLVVGPSPHDSHHAHVAVGRALRDALAAPSRPPWWAWGLWGELPLPTIFAPFGDEELRAAGHVLTAHAGELSRNRYLALLEGRARAAGALGAERVFGFGRPARGGSCAELLCELSWQHGEWWAGRPRQPDLERPLEPVPRARRLGWWLDAPSFAERLAESGGP